MNYSLRELFFLLDAENQELPFVNRATPTAGELFPDIVSASEKMLWQENQRYANQDDAALVSGLLLYDRIDFSRLPKSAYRLHELSAYAFDIFITVWMSELPLEAELLRFGRKVLAAKDSRAAELVVGNRNDDDVRLVLETVQKVWHEIDRLRGLLRFAPDNNGRYLARCEPDYYILPALGVHFSLRFGTTPWAIIDDRRGLILSCFSGTPELCTLSAEPEENHARREEADQWENLWCNYHKTINNASRANSGLQRQFMPKRYWKNLPEMK